MKKISIIFLFVIWVFNGFAIEIPLLTGRVNDCANLLSATTVINLEQRLTQLEQEDSTKVVILTIPSLKGVPIENFAIAVFNGWGIGRTKIDNGVLLIIALEDRSIRIEVGRGLEGRLTDVTSARIIRDDIKPLLAQGDFNSGITQGINSIIKVVKGEYIQDNSSKETNYSSWLTNAIEFFLIPFFVASALPSVRSSQKSRLIYATIGSIIAMSIAYYWGKQNTFINLSLTSGISFAVCYISTYIGRFIHLGGGGGSGGSDGGSSFSGGGGSSGGGGASGKF